jgi:KTSC domain
MNLVFKKLDGIPVRLPGKPPQDVFVNFRYVDSSNVERVGWDEHGNMYITYKNGGTYVYFGVTRQRAVAAAYSPSVGRYIARRIKGSFPAVKLVG